MPVQYQPYRSMYVSQRSPEIAQTLRDRFVQNFAAQNELQEKLMQLQAAPFEGDLQAKKQLDEQISGTIKQLVNRGDYENMTAPIMQLASRYNMESAPIQQNRALYDAYKATLDKQYEAEDIDYEDYQGALDISAMNYNGLTKNEDGTYGNYFSGTQAITNPKIQERIQEALNGIVASEFGEEYRILGQGEDGELTVETKAGIKTVSPERVNSVLDAIFMDSHVQSYLDRKGEIRSMKLDDNQARDIVQGVLPETDLSNADPEDLKQMAGKVIRQNMENQYRQSAISRYSYEQQETSEKYYWDKWWLQKQKAAADASTANTGGIGVAGALVEESLGMNASQLTSAIDTSESVLTDLRNPEYLHNQFGLNENITYDDLFEMPRAEVVQLYGRDQAVIFDKARKAATESLNSIMINNKLMEDAKESVGFTPENVRSKLLSNAKIQAPLKQIADEVGASEDSAALILADFAILDNNKPSFMSRETYPQRLAKAVNKYPEGSADRKFAERVATHLLEKHEGKQSYTPGPYSNPRSLQERTLDTLMRRTYTAVAGEMDAMNDFLEEQTKRTHNVPLYDVAPGMNSKLANSVSQFMQNTSAGKFQYINPSTGAMGTLEEVLPAHMERGEVAEDFDQGSASIVGDVLYSPYSFGLQGATMQLTLQDSEKRTAKVHIPMSNVDIPALESYYSSAPYQLSRAISSYYSAGYDEARIPVRRADGQDVYINVDLDSPSGKTYYVTDAQGNQISNVGDLDSSLRDGYLSTIFDDGARLLPF
jgi:hypothetical protein